MLLAMMNTCAKSQGHREGSCISGVSVLQKVTLKFSELKPIWRAQKIIRHDRPPLNLTIVR